jgi:hypothetical protein
MTESGTNWIETRNKTRNKDPFLERPAPFQNAAIKLLYCTVREQNPSQKKRKPGSTVTSDIGFHQGKTQDFAFNPSLRHSLAEAMAYTVSTLRQSHNLGSNAA